MSPRVLDLTLIDERPVAIYGGDVVPLFRVDRESNSLFSSRGVVDLEGMGMEAGSPRTGVDLCFDPGDSERGHREPLPPTKKGEIRIWIW